MSQIYRSTSAGPSPPDVPTEFIVDEGGPAIPVANELQLLGRDNIDNDDNGIRTNNDPDGSNIIYVELTNRTTRTVTTTDDTPTVIFQESVGADKATINVWGSVQSYNVTDDLSSTFDYAGAFRVVDGATIVELSIEYSNEFYDVGMGDTDITLSISGNDIVVTVYGLNGKTIKWSCLFEYRILPKV